MASLIRTFEAAGSPNCLSGDFGWRGLERQRDFGGAGHQHQQHRPSATATGRGGAGGGAEAQAKSELGPQADFRRGGGGEIDRSSPAPEGFARWSLRLLEEKVLYSRDWRPLQARRSANTAESPFADRLPEREAPMCRGYSLAGGNCRVARD